jgi:MarC family membrane protein
MNWTLILNFGAALFATVNPIGNLPIFVSFTAGERKAVQCWLAFFIAATVLTLLLLFLVSGNAILNFFGITLAAFRIAGGIILLLTGISMVRGEQTKLNREMAAQASANDFKAAEFVYRKILVPLGIPMFVGPGSISTVVLYSSQAPRGGTFLGLIGVIFTISTLVFVILWAGTGLRRFLGELGVDVATRLLGMILAAIGIQFILGGLADSTMNFIQPSFIPKAR